MTERMTFICAAILHGDSEELSTSETYEAETREELMAKLAKDMRDFADELEGVDSSD